MRIRGAPGWFGWKSEEYTNRTVVVFYWYCDCDRTHYQTEDITDLQGADAALEQMFSFVETLGPRRLCPCLEKAIVEQVFREACHVQSHLGVYQKADRQE
jgi:hypothetical protein